MTPEERAKQFMPFDSMKGLYGALEGKKQCCFDVGRHGISEEDALHNNEVMNSLRKRMRVRVSYWENSRDEITEGAVTEFIPEYRVLSLDGKAIDFDNIYRIDIIPG